MDYEQKYKEALKRADSLTEKYGGRDFAEYVFPELAESEDERIRKFLIEILSHGSWRKEWPFSPNEVVAWLEKRKENPKTADSIPSDCVSDAKCEDRWHKVTDSLPDNGRLVLAKDCLGNVLLARYDGENWEVNVYDNEDHYCHNSISKWCEIPSEKQKEQKPEWSEDWREEDIQTRFAFYTYKNEEDDGVLYLSNVFVEEASRNHGFGTKILAAAEKVAETIGATTICLKVKQDSPANAWYRKNGYGYVAFEDGYDWLEKNLEYMKPNKQEWNDEDEARIERIAAFMWRNRKGDTDDIFLQEQDVAWLKSLRPSWKPSEEQMEVLAWCKPLFCDPTSKKILESLINDLNKLM